VTIFRPKASIPARPPSTIGSRAAHVYDLHAIRAHYHVAEVLPLVRTIMLADVQAYGHQFPAYRENPIAETKRAVAGMTSDPGFSGRYAVFHTRKSRADFILDPRKHVHNLFPQSHQ
jgi:hypothetical protein